MKIVTIVSPDKLTPSMFVDFYQAKNPYKEVIAVDINSLFSTEAQNQIVKDIVKYIEKNDKSDTTDIIIKYKIKINTEVILTDDIMNYSGYVLKFDIFSTHPEIVKAKDLEFIKALTADWLENIERLEK